jgi:putative DNA primase/helicase
MRSPRSRACMDSPLTIAKACGRFKATRRGYICQCPVHDDRNPSCEVWQGEVAVLVRCYAGCPSDLIVDELRDRGFRLGRKRPRDEAEARSGRRRLRRLKDKDTEPDKSQRSQGDENKATTMLPCVSREMQLYQWLAAAIWCESVDPLGTMVETYLRGRGLDLRGAGEVIRFHPHCPRGLDRQPAMITLLHDLSSDRPVAIHRTFLRPGGGHDGKMMLGPAAGAAAKLTPHAATFDDDLGTWCERLHICEGIETGLGLLQMGMQPVWALLSAGEVARMPVMFAVGELIACADSDDIGGRKTAAIWERHWTGQNAAFAAVDRWRQAGKKARARLAFNEKQTGDFADVAQQG